MREVIDHQVGTRLLRSALPMDSRRCARRMFQRETAVASLGWATDDEGGVPDFADRSFRSPCGKAFFFQIGRRCGLRGAAREAQFVHGASARLIAFDLGGVRGPPAW